MSNKLQWVCVDGVTMLRKGNELFANLDEYLLAMDREIKELKTPAKVDITKRIVVDKEPDREVDTKYMDNLMERIMCGKNIYGVFM